MDAVGRPEEEETMSNGKADEAKGRAKEAAGSLLGDDELKREGRIDQTTGKVKKKVEETVDKVRDTLKKEDS